MYIIYVIGIWNHDIQSCIIDAQPKGQQRYAHEPEPLRSGSRPQPLRDPARRTFAELVTRRTGAPPV